MRPAGEVAGGRERDAHDLEPIERGGVAKLVVEGPGDLLGRSPRSARGSRRWAIGASTGPYSSATWAAVQMRLPPLRLARY